MSRAAYDVASGSIQMKVLCPRAGYARKGGEWSLRVGEVVVVCVCVLGDDARSPAADQRALAQQPTPF